MNKKELKEQLVNECLRIKQEIIDNAKLAVDDIQKMANEYGQPKDRYDSYRMQLLRKRDLHAQQLQKAIEEKGIILKIDASKSSNIVGFGSVVITSMQKLFISVGLGKIKINNEHYFAVSVVSPIFKQLENKTKGDSFTINNKEFEILEVF